MTLTVLRDFFFFPYEYFDINNTSLGISVKMFIFFSFINVKT